MFSTRLLPRALLAPLALLALLALLPLNLSASRSLYYFTLLLSVDFSQSDY